MSYSQTTLDDFADQIGQSLDDENERYWTRLEKYYAIVESLRVWGAYTSYWRTRGNFSSTANEPYYDMSVKLPLLRPRTSTLQTIVQEIQFHCLEAPNGISGSGMSGQVNISSILKAVARARNRFAVDSQLPLQKVTNPAPATPDGIVSIDQRTVYVHRAGWQDAFSGQWTNLWRQDEWAFDKGTPDWMLTPGAPIAFSEALNSPLRFQIYPPPNNTGNLELISCLDQNLTLTDPASTLNFPDEWVHGIKYAALNDLFDSGMIADPVRADYCETRYQQAVSGVKNIKTIMRLIVNNNQVPIDSFAALDAGLMYWRNQTDLTQLAGVMHDFLILAPVPAGIYGIDVDVVQSAPIPANGGDYLQIGNEELANLSDYCINYLMLKCGGRDLQDTFGNYDSFMSKINQRKANNDVKIMYLDALMDQPAKEEKERPTMRRPKKKQ